MSEHRRRIDKVLDPEFLADLPDWPFDELRRRQAECLEIETEVSYVRRMTQARIGILEAEIDRRASGGSIADLIAALRRSSPLHMVIDRMEADLAARHKVGQA
jgi:hypothetical protein